MEIDDCKCWRVKWRSQRNSLNQWNWPAGAFQILSLESRTRPALTSYSQNQVAGRPIEPRPKLKSAHFGVCLLVQLPNFKGKWAHCFFSRAVPVLQDSARRPLQFARRWRGKGRRRSQDLKAQCSSVFALESGCSECASPLRPLLAVAALARATSPVSGLAWKAADGFGQWLWRAARPTRNSHHFVQPARHHGQWLAFLPHRSLARPPRKLTGRPTLYRRLPPLGQPLGRRRTAHWRTGTNPRPKENEVCAAHHPAHRLRRHLLRNALTDHIITFQK